MPEVVTSLSDKFFDYWESLPLVKYLKVSNYVEVTNKALRKTIMRILTEGFEDINPESNTKQTRKVLSAKEINNKINELLKENVAQSNLYFHLEKLQKNGFIHEVFTLKKGKRYTTYYGKTAQIISYREEDDFVSLLYKSLNEPVFEEILNKLNPKMTSEIRKTLDSFIEITNAELPKFNEWIKDNAEVFNIYDTHFDDLHMLYSSIQNKEKLLDLLTQLGNLLKIDG
ncbi:MAG: hypothetical protein ACXAD7_16195 [Candidatus Kariarchaeaceae archaeon]|jgi:DNA-binding transcriptional ArsR family regulator